MGFSIHTTLQADTINLGAFLLCEVLLMNDNRFPWIILVPTIPDLQDFHEIPTQHRDLLFQEIEKATATIQKHWRVDKMNVAALGNQVSQLHIHVIGRRRTDEAWPSPVWGHGTPIPYSAADMSDLIPMLKREIAIIAQ